MDNNFGIAKKEKMDKNYVTEGVSSLCGLEENIDLGNLYRRKLHLYHKVPFSFSSTRASSELKSLCIQTVRRDKPTVSKPLLNIF